MTEWQRPDGCECIPNPLSDLGFNTNAACPVHGEIIVFPGDENGS